MDNKEQKISIKTALAALLVAAIGIGTSLYLTRVHYDVISGKTGAACDISDTISCSTAAASEYSELMGIPVSILGGITYALLFVIWLILAIRPKNPSIVSFMRISTFLISGLCVLYSLYMAFLAATVVEVLCPGCMLLYGVALSIFGMSVTEGRTVMVLRALNERFLKISGNIAASLGTLVMITSVAIWVGSSGTGQAKTPKQNDKHMLTTESNIPMEITLHNSPSKGPQNAPVTIVEFSDFMCPYCKLASHMIKDVLKERGKDVKFVFMHFPLDQSCNSLMKRQLHDGSCMAAMAADCSGEQGMFWEYSDMLFDLEREWNKKSLEPMAGELGLDLKKFRECMASEFTINRLKLVVEQGNRIGIRKTPSFFINGKLYEGKLSPEDLIKEIDKAKAAK